MIKSIFFNICFYVWTTLICTYGLHLLLAPTSDPLLRLARTWARGNLWLAQTIIGLKVKIKGKENLPPAPFILAAKHQSALETFAVYAFLEKPVFVLKKELLYIPIFGWLLKKAGHISINRSSGPKAIRSMLDGAQKRMDEKKIIVIFPEGTRTRPGQQTQYKPGIAIFYHHLDVPIIPVALNSGLFWGRKAFIKKAGTCTIEFLPPIKKGLNKQEFMTTLKNTIERKTESLYHEA